MIIIYDDILNAKEQYIAHQCNCLTVKSHGLSKTIADAYPWADHYSTRRSLNGRNYAIEKDRDIPGTFKILHSPDKKKSVICMFAQWTPGIPQKYKTYPLYQLDTYESRVSWFAECLIRLKESNLETKAIAFPWKIGCGLARGSWPVYKKMLELFEKESGIEVILYKLQ